ncbi:YihY/virulence factor BrkB family protein [Actinoplanes sp. NPDC049265]|uniref:YihY/virulence factor BrkB family protein n=1 Tax=Actinoplanes sp. NPDC049265 TaxID=3363902 RepID=UPI00371FCC73
MSSTEPVPETRMMPGDELSADDALEALWHYGRWPLLRDAFVRFRYGDGFSHSRALALQLCLAIVPFLIALSGLATDLGAEEGGKVVADTVVALTPGASEPLVRDLLSMSDDEEDEDHGEFALVVGLITGLVALTQAMAQIERGANRIYGVERDRPALAKYVRAAILAVVAGVPALTGFLLLVAGGAAGDSLAGELGWGSVMRTTWDWVRWPLSLALIVVAVGVLFEQSPRRKQPALSWLLFGAGIATALWWLASLALGGYVRISDDFDATYGPLTAIMALLIWANLTGVAFFFGLAFAAQLEAQRVGVVQPAPPDRWEPSADD